MDYWASALSGPDCKGLFTHDITPFTKAVWVSSFSRLSDGKVIVPGAEVRGFLTWVDKQNFCYGFIIRVVKKFHPCGYNPVVQGGISKPQNGGVPLPDIFDGKIQNFFPFGLGFFCRKGFVVSSLNKVLNFS